MRKSDGHFSPTMVRLILIAISVLVAVDLFVPSPSQIRIYLEFIIFAVAIGLSILLAKLNLFRYAIVYGLTAFIFNPYFNIEDPQLHVFRPNFFVVIVSIFVCIFLPKLLTRARHMSSVSSHR